MNMLENAFDKIIRKMAWKSYIKEFSFSIDKDNYEGYKLLLKLRSKKKLNLEYINLFKKYYPTVNINANLGKLEIELEKYEAMSLLSSDVNEEEEIHKSDLKSNIDELSEFEMVNYLEKELEFWKRASNVKIYNLESTIKDDNDEEYFYLDDENYLSEEINKKPLVRSLKKDE
ncbi:MAG: hypothetical protein IJ572_01900 [Bacilli bacterium]|nr:hypothetical protein [Bacilli bacterium]